MSIVSEVRARLTAISPAVFKYVAGAAEFAALSAEPLSTPAAYVLIEEEQAAENHRMTGPVLQRLEADIAVIIVTRNVSDETGGAAADDIEALKASVRRALIGFVLAASDGCDPIIHISGNLLKAKNGSVWHRELFGASYYLEEQG